MREEETLVVFLHGSVELWFPSILTMAAVTTDSLKEMMSGLMGELLAQQVTASATAAKAAAEIQNAFNREMTDNMLKVIQASGNKAETAEAKTAENAGSSKDRTETKHQNKIDPKSFSRIEQFQGGESGYKDWAMDVIRTTESVCPGFRAMVTEYMKYPQTEKPESR